MKENPTKQKVSRYVTRKEFELLLGIVADAIHENHMRQVSLPEETYKDLINRILALEKLPVMHEGKSQISHNL